jgi:hypothetical protein
MSSFNSQLPGVVLTVHDLVWVQPGQLDAQQQQQAQESAAGLPLVTIDATQLLGTGCFGWVSGWILYRHEPSGHVIGLTFVTAAASSAQMPGRLCKATLHV